MKASELFSHWNQVREDLITMVDSFEDEELGYKPFPGAWSVGEILLHIAGAEKGWIQYVVIRELDDWPDDFKLEHNLSKDLIKGKLDEVHNRTNEFLSSLDIKDLERSIDFPWDGKGRLGWIIWHVIEHEIHHRGELSLILGILGREGLEV